MEDFKTRLIEEKDLLLDKVTKLGKFLASDKTETLSEGNLPLLEEQLNVMNRYLNILIIRIELIG